MTTAGQGDLHYKREICFGLIASRSSWKSARRVLPKLFHRARDHFFVRDSIFKLKLIGFFSFFFYRNQLKFTSANLEEKYAANGIHKMKLGNRSGSLDKLAEQIVFMHLRAIRELGR